MSQSPTNVPPTDGVLTGKTVLRFAHAYESGGGTERYLDDLDRALLARNAMTIVRLHLTRKADPGGPTEEQIGRGRLILVPLPQLPGDESQVLAEDHSLGARLKQGLRDWVLYNPLVWAVYGARWCASLQLHQWPGQAVGAGRAAAEAIRTQRVDMAMLHYFGGADADEVVTEARKSGVPFAVLNHYANDRFLHLAVRKHAMLANALAGVNGLDLPRYVRPRFTNLSDGVDTDFFRHAHARPLADAPAQPVILMPARVVREKGQMDLIRAVAALRQSGLECSVGFAGRTDSTGFVDELKQEIARCGLTAHVRFLGGLNLEALRDWYGASALVVLPTYHHEGLPRVVLEAQAMGVPVVAYSSGGVADGITSGRTGYLLAPGDITGLTARLRELLTDPGARQTMGANGRAVAEERFSLAALAGRHEQFYRRVIAGAGAKP